MLGNTHRPAKLATPARRPAPTSLNQVQYAARSGVEGTICEFVNGHRARRGRYHGVAKTHVQNVLTAIAISLERLAAHAPPATDHPRPLTAFQLYLEARDSTWESWWRQGKRPRTPKIPDRLAH
ncbi:transposase [Streptomyces zaomyceticus]|uniref:transposase n=1 Tax=Streptomyces zaomyceticus TaxID=68286 RepID=UPI00379F6E42